MITYTVHAWSIRVVTDAASLKQPAPSSTAADYLAPIRVVTDAASLKPER